MMSTPRHLCHPIFLRIIFSSLLLLAPATPGAQAADTIDKGRNISDDGSTLVSAGRSFTLGFFSPAGVPTKRYLGIWFSVSQDTVYWVANRDHPLNDTSGVLLMSDSGSLLLLDGGSGNAVWSSGSTNSPSAGARLLDSGNLVVQGQNNNATALWQSFDHPCNNMLPGMKIGKNRWTGTEWYLSSWRSAADPAPGNFKYVTSYIADDVGRPENVLWGANGTKVYRTGPWNGKRFNGVPEMTQFSDIFAFQLTDSPGEVTYGYVAKAAAPYSRVTVTETGRVQRLVWDGNSLSWKSFSDAPRDPCDYYAKCGPFGLCDSDAMATSLCGCVQGFSPTSQSEWSIREYSRGCQRNVALDCTNQSRATTDDFTVQHGVKLPDTANASVDMGISLDQCRARCLANCSCVAYAAADLKAGGDGTGCIIWTNSFVDVRLIDEGQDLYLRLAKSEIERGGKNPKGSRLVPIAAAIAPAVVSGTLLVCTAVVLVLWCMSQPKRPPPVGPAISSVGLILPSIDYEILNESTGNFLVGQIGQGSFGTVYECKLPEGESIRIGIPAETSVAVKRLRQAAIVDTYERELQVMCRMRHVNLVQLLAYCRDEIEHSQGRKEKVEILIFEYMKNGNLDSYIFDDDVERRRQLSWKKRLEIITSIAEGVYYLHVASGERVIHRDLKPSNVLLDHNYSPKIADFGMAKRVIVNPTGPATLFVSFGYSAPECGEDGNTTPEADVYSFGVVLLETIKGERNGHSQLLVHHAKDSWNSPMHLLDERLPLSEEEETRDFKDMLERCIRIGLLCVQEVPEQRPDISSVLHMLKCRGVELPKPAGRNVGRASENRTDGTSEIQEVACTPGQA